MAVPRKLVHGVFGTLMRGNAALPEVPTLPSHVAERWRAVWGDAMVDGAARAIAAPPPLDLSLARADAVSPEGETLLPNHVRLRDAEPVPELAGYAEGGWWVQDVAASLPARLLGPGAGTVLDLCAAPGGKTLQLAAAGWAVTAVDSSQSRLARLRDNLRRTGLSAEVVRADVLDWQPAQPADAVLVDAPCSATGIFRRHPDVLYRARPDIVAEMADLQRRLLARAADWVKPGGALVYATCSLEREEGEDQAEAFLAADLRFTLEPAAPSDSGPFGTTERGWLRTLPGMLGPEGGCDGFFVARFRRGGQS